MLFRRNLVADGVLSCFKKLIKPASVSLLIYDNKNCHHFITPHASETVVMKNTDHADLEL